MAEKAKKVIAFIEENPGKTGKQIAWGVPGVAVSAWLTTLTRAGQVFRCQDKKGKWVYFATWGERNKYVLDLPKKLQEKQVALMRTEIKKDRLFQQKNPQYANPADLEEAVRTLEQALAEAAERDYDSEYMEEEYMEDAHRASEPDPQTEKPTILELLHPLADKMNGQAIGLLEQMKAEVEQGIEDQKVLNNALQHRIDELKERNRLLDTIAKKTRELQDLTEMKELLRQELEEETEKFLVAQQEVLKNPADDEPLES